MSSRHTVGSHITMEMFLIRGTFLCSTDCIYGEVLGLITCSLTPFYSLVFRHQLGSSAP